MGLFDKIEKAATKGADLMGKANDGFANVQKKMTQKNTGNYEMFESFGGGYITFTITERSLIYGKKEFPFAELSPIVLKIKPSKLRVGAAYSAHGDDELLLQFPLGQAEQFAAAMAYANEKIAEANGIEKRYLTSIQAANGTRVELYDTYLKITEVSGGLLGDAFGNKSLGEIINLSDISAEITTLTDSDAEVLNIYLKADDSSPAFSVPLKDGDDDAANMIIAATTSSIQQAVPTSLLPDTWEQVVGEKHVFPLAGAQLVVDPTEDAMNSYRKRFYNYADICFENLLRRYDAQIFDLQTFLHFLPDLYSEELTQLCKKAVEVLLLEGVFTITEEGFLQEQLGRYHYFADYIEGIYESMNEAAGAAQSAIQGIMGLIPDLDSSMTASIMMTRLSRGTTSAGDIAKTVAISEAFNLIKGGATSALMSRAEGISPENAQLIYDSINKRILCNLIKIEFRGVTWTLIDLLNENGIEVGASFAGNAELARNVFTNLSNPSFPADKKIEMMIKILQTDPYEPDYQNYLVDTYGDNEEVQEILAYFSPADIKADS